eukprot:TRINITY_DN6527_c0_g1_i2.p1 TRINITY_DN6527_c0_g1~~TRINITY_DN6527_c0_g1_i2.p1  ORF type:complete len:141 (-),score=8.51 TRINITY_DN6527_c0_g1_i2:68-490(-)
MKYWEWLNTNMTDRLENMLEVDRLPYLLYFFNTRISKNGDHDLSPVVADDEDISDENKSSSTTHSTTTTTTTTTTTKDTNNNISEMEEKNMCKICYERECDTVILTCNHSVMCYDCSQLELKDCPICRKPIKAIIKIFKS